MHVPYCDFCRTYKPSHAAALGLLSVTSLYHVKTNDHRSTRFTPLGTPRDSSFLLPTFIARSQRNTHDKASKETGK